MYVCMHGWMHVGIYIYDVLFMYTCMHALMELVCG